ncbi:STAS domain-containing protein [Streptomyces sp. NPDC049879]|uniref:STAS domain-containing protein n=1 Tax=Streptomyces sp. NPDC049879 TaxID=3365598 RepID=UPI003790D282
MARDIHGPSRLRAGAAAGADGAGRDGPGKWAMMDELGTVLAETVAGGVLVVRVLGEIDAESATGLEEALAVSGPAAARRTVRTVVDLSETDFADSRVLHVLLTAERAHRAAGGRMVVAGPFGETVRRLFEVTGTAGYFTLADTVEAALTELDRPQTP